ncbi:hypothetical protein Tco_1278823, partial [Tanacetum coccineum]
MRTKRQQKVPQNLEDYVLNTNNSKNNNKKTVSKKNPDELNQSVNTEMNEGTKQGGSDVVNYDKEVRDEVNSVLMIRLLTVVWKMNWAVLMMELGWTRRKAFPLLTVSLKKQIMNVQRIIGLMREGTM